MTPQENSQEPEKQRNVILSPSRMQMGEYARNEWVCTVEYGTTTKDIMQPAFWMHVAAQLRPYDHIEVRIDDGSWIANLLVLGSDRTWARVHLLQFNNLTTGDVAATQSSQHEVVFRGPHLKHCVVRLSDRAVVKEGLSTKVEANRWMQEHEQAT